MQRAACTLLFWTLRSASLSELGCLQGASPPRPMDPPTHTCIRIRTRVRRRAPPCADAGAFTPHPNLFRARYARRRMQHALAESPAAACSCRRAGMRENMPSPLRAAYVFAFLSQQCAKEARASERDHFTNFVAVFSFMHAIPWPCSLHATIGAGADPPPRGGVDHWPSLHVSNTCAGQHGHGAPRLATCMHASIHTRARARAPPCTMHGRL